MDAAAQSVFPGRRPEFARLLAALRHEEADCVPFVELVVEPDVKAAWLGRPIARIADDVAFWVSAGYDYYPIVLSIVKPGRAVGGEKTGSYSVYDRQYTERTWAAMHRGAIAGFADFDAYPWPSLDAMDLAVIDETAALLPDGMKLIVILGKLFTSNWLLQGAESFYINVYDQPDLLEAIYDKVATLTFGLFERVIAHPAVGAVFHPDDMAGTAGLLVDAAHFRAHVFPWYAKMGRICRQLGKPMLFHSDGNLWPLFDDIIDAGFAGLHPIDPKALDINAVHDAYGDRLALLGNIDMDFPLSRGTPDDVERLVAERIARLAPGGGYALSSGNSVAEYIPLANYRAMLEAGHRFGRYPIAVS